MSNQTIAKTILEQLGGHKFVVMTGAKNLMAVENGLSMKLAGTANKSTHLNITLDPMDTYTVEFVRVRKLTVHPVSSFSGVYFDRLVSVFEAETQLRTSLER